MRRWPAMLGMMLAVSVSCVSNRTLPLTARPACDTCPQPSHEAVFAKTELELRYALRMKPPDSYTQAQIDRMLQSSIPYAEKWYWSDDSLASMTIHHEIMMDAHTVEGIQTRLRKERLIPSSWVVWASIDCGDAVCIYVAIPFRPDSYQINRMLYGPIDVTDGHRCLIYSKAQRTLWTNQGAVAFSMETAR